MAAEIDRLRARHVSGDTSPSLRNSLTAEVTADSAQATDNEMDDNPKETDDIWETDLDFVDYIMKSPPPPEDPPLEEARRQSAPAPRYNLGMKRLPSDGGGNDGCLTLWGNGNGNRPRIPTDVDVLKTRLMFEGQHSEPHKK